MYLVQQAIGHNISTPENFKSLETIPSTTHSVDINLIPSMESPQRFYLVSTIFLKVTMTDLHAVVQKDIGHGTRHGTGRVTVN